MPPLASLAASLLVASPPLAACGPPCRFRRRRRKPSLPSAYPQPTLNLPSNAFPCRSRRPLLATSERSSRADHLILLSACHAQGTRAEWAPLKLNTTNCRPGHGKMQVSFSHVGSGGAKKTSPLSLGTWPTEGPGHEEALRWYMNVQSKLHPLRGKVGPTDVRVQHLMLACRQAAKAAKAALDEEEEEEGEPEDESEEEDEDVVAARAKTRRHDKTAKQAKVRIPSRILERTPASSYASLHASLAFAYPLRILCVSARVSFRVSLS
jgi:hypothetical protein